MKKNSVKNAHCTRACLVNFAVIVKLFYQIKSTPKEIDDCFYEYGLDKFDIFY